MTAHAPRVGRPRRSSRQMLEDAAAELFLEQGYAATSIEQVTQRAGVSRNTFFNYFAAKSDLLWIDLDRTLEALPAALERAAAAPALPAALPAALPHALDALGEALRGLAAEHPPAAVPWALSQSELMGTRPDLEASALARLARPAATIERFLNAYPGERPPAERSRAIAFSVTAAAAAGISAWVGGGVHRRPLEAEVAAAIGPVLHGFRAAG